MIKEHFGPNLYAITPSNIRDYLDEYGGTVILTVKHAYVVDSVNIDVLSGGGERIILTDAINCDVLRVVDKASIRDRYIISWETYNA